MASSRWMSIRVLEHRDIRCSLRLACEADPIFSVNSAARLQLLCRQVMHAAEPTRQSVARGRHFGAENCVLIVVCSCGGRGLVNAKRVLTSLKCDGRWRTAHCAQAMWSSAREATLSSTESVLQSRAGAAPRRRGWQGYWLHRL
jgi:hypothetical protein